MHDISQTELYKIPSKGSYDFKNIRLDDPAVWSAFARGKTCGIFQCESKLGIEWCQKIKPRSIKELSDVISGIRPGVLESKMTEAYVRRKNGEEEATTGIHKELDIILKDTYACLWYQEQSIKIAQEIAGYSETEADALRKSLGKKLPEEVAKQKIIFAEGAAKVGKVTKEQAEQIFSWIEKGQRYLFNLSHSVSYALTAYYCMYQKVHFPTEFYCAWLTFSNDKPDPQEERYNLIQDSKLHNIQVMPPTVLDRNIDFKIIDNKKVRFGVSHIKGIGNAAVKVLENPNLDLSTFANLIKNSKKLKRNVVESFIKAGACDSYGLQRNTMIRIINAIFGRQRDKNEETTANQVKKLTDNELECFLANLDRGVDAAFRAIIIEEACIAKRVPVIESKIKWLSEAPKDTSRTKAIYESLYLGIALTCNAADDFANSKENVKTCKQAISEDDKERFNLHVTIDDIQKKTSGPKSKNPGQEYCYLTVSDRTMALESVVIWAKEYEKYKEILDINLVASISIRKGNWQGRSQYVVTALEILG